MKRARRADNQDRSTTGRPYQRQPTSALNGLAADHLDAILLHPRHQWAYKTVIELIYQLRASRSDADLSDVQHALLTAILDIERRRAAISRVRKRTRKKAHDIPGDAPDLESGLDPKDPQSWDLEYMAHERVCRQLRSVGDALAWRAFGYERNFILALSRGEPAGPMAGKHGLQAELDFMESCRRNGARLVLLHDLTNVLRLGDASVFDDETVSFHEIKTNDRYQNSAQRHRLTATADSLTRGTPLLLGGQTLVRMPMPYRTHLDNLREILDLAREHGMHDAQISGGRAITAASLHTAPRHWAQEEFGPEFDRRMRGSWRSIGIKSNDHKLMLGSLDRVGRISTAPPWAIYPLAPEVAAGLITDSIFFFTSMSPTAITTALAARNIVAQWLQRLDGSENPNEPLLAVALPLGDGRAQATSMNLVELNRLLLELVDLEVWSEHLAVLLHEQQRGSAPWPYFPDEHAVWA